MRAALRRATPTGAAPIVRTAAFTIDMANKRITTGTGRDVRLTP